MLAGNAGVGKTALVRNKLDCLPESCMTTKVPFNYYTNSLMLQGKSAAFDLVRGTVKAHQVNSSTLYW